MISRTFIDRPILASVLSILIMLAGAAAIFKLPVAQFPDITPPVVSVTAQYSGANADTLQKTVAGPIEDKVNGVENMIYMESTSAANGTMTLNVYFDIGTDPDQAATNVNNRVQTALPVLPDSVKQNGVIVQKKSTNMLQIVTLSSPEGKYDTVFLSNYAYLNVVNALKRLPGVGDATILGAQDYAMRVWLRPDRLAELKMTTADVVQAIKEQNAQFAVGKIGDTPNDGSPQFTYTMSAQGRMTDPEAFENIILRANPDGSNVRIRDVARVELGARDYSMSGTLNGKPGVMVATYLQPGANALDVANSVKATMAQLATSFPEGVSYSVPYDTTPFVKASIHEVVKTLLEAIVLVFLVVFLFLQNFRATLIPCIAVPVSLVGTFAGMYLLGFSINTLTLFGLVLAIGIVVDDAIVVLENVERIMRDEHLPPREATLRAMQEVTGPVVAIVLVLCAVFVPVGFLGGLTGQLYKQFAITIAVSVTISGFVALTLTPALCALLLKPGHTEPAAFFRWFNRLFDKATERFGAAVAAIIRRWVLALLCAGGVLLMLGGLVKTVPTALIPPEDQGYYLATVQLPDAASLARTKQVAAQAGDAAKGFEGNADVVVLSGYDILTGNLKTSAATVFSVMKPWEERGVALNIRNAIYDFMHGTQGNREAMILGFNPPPIPGLGTTGGAEFYIQNRGEGDIQQLAKVTQDFISKAGQQPELTGVTTLMRANVPQVYVDVNRDRAKALGVPINSIFDALQATFGSLYVNDFNKFGQTYRVLLQSEADARMRPEDVGKVYVRSSGGQMIPLGAVADVRQISGPEIINRFNGFMGAKLMANPATGHSSGEAIAAIERVAKEVLPEGYALAWTGTAFQEKRAGSAATLAFAFGLVVVFLILAAQYESWKLPLVVVTAVPFAIFGAFAAVWLRGLNCDIYFQIGLITLIGLAAKNAILIVEFAHQLHQQGHSAREAALQAARLRFRPIVMTSMAFILGVVPLAISFGAGANSQHSIGTGVIGGMLAATFLAVLFVPMFFSLVSGKGAAKQPAAATKEHDHA
ncbi:multidrug efflux RND transporter permease subunit [Niveibacterium umoris]|uniref:Efflux pump membrane transporter n=1 Tax=Niveibacterium umoris TaxID=1193620 RepID=A0A840BMK0_9RHOO|nr:multidrug efflux RND transporter permease subunit [Niveibacterium umoris]MBB4014761.1 hydrophobe/amphiphile efflux-1 (HAE1) family protein [Niveibacterium umoris]